MTENIEIRDSLPAELPAIKALHLAAFGDEESEEVAQLAIDLVRCPEPVLSLVAVSNGQLLGHIVFSPVTFTDNPELTGSILSPMGVSPAAQKRGIGSQLIAAGLDHLKQAGVDAVFVLGDPAYYGRSGFHCNHQVQTPYPVPYPEAWQVLELMPGVLEGREGSISCVEPLMVPGLW